MQLTIGNLVQLRADHEVSRRKVELKELLDRAVELTKEARDNEKVLLDALEKWVATSKAENDEEIEESKQSIEELVQKADAYNFERKDDFHSALAEIQQAPPAHIEREYKRSHAHIHEAYMFLLNEQQAPGGGTPPAHAGGTTATSTG